MTRSFTVAAPCSGSGKTMVCLGLMAALTRRGLPVAPFKAGPDYIDAGLHYLATGRASNNLDSWMCSRRVVREIFARYASVSSMAVIEGVMGLYDGFSGTSQAGSTAEIASLTGSPVLLVVDASSMAGSAAALVKGFAEFDPGLNLLGVVFNKVGSENHRDLLAGAMERLSHIPLFGCLPRRQDLRLPSRHLGLITADESRESPDDRKRMRNFAATLAAWVEEHLDLDALVAACPDQTLTPPRDRPRPEAQARIGVARDKAFSFYYQENLRLLEEAGAELVPFSPRTAPHLPSGLQGLYLGGGYPEVHAHDLANNRGLRREVRGFCRSGRPVYAECGGFMYLMQEVVTDQRQRFPMCGVFDFSAHMRDRSQALGYRRVRFSHDTFLGPAGTDARGHEFHYSTIAGDPRGADAVYTATDRRDRDTGPRGFLARHGHLALNTIGSYVHLHFASNPGLADNFVAACRETEPHQP
jgi:cobyrinic acid a,c-diamide synthase